MSKLRGPQVLLLRSIKVRCTESEEAPTQTRGKGLDSASYTYSSTSVRECLEWLTVALWEELRVNWLVESLQQGKQPCALQAGSMTGAPREKVPNLKGHIPLDPEAALARAGDSGPSAVHYGRCISNTQLGLAHVYEDLTAKKYLDAAGLLQDDRTQACEVRSIGPTSPSVPSTVDRRRLRRSEDGPMGRSDFDGDQPCQRPAAHPLVLVLLKQAMETSRAMEAQKLKESSLEMRAFVKTMKLKAQPEVSGCSRDEWDACVDSIKENAAEARARSRSWVEGNGIANYEVMAHVASRISDEEALQVWRGHDGKMVELNSGRVITVWRGRVKQLEDVTDDVVDEACDRLMQRYGYAAPWQTQMFRFLEGGCNRFVGIDRGATSVRHQVEYGRSMIQPDGPLAKAMAESDRVSKMIAEACPFPLCSDAQREVPWSDAFPYYICHRELPENMRSELNRLRVRSFRVRWRSSRNRNPPQNWLRWLMQRVDGVNRASIPPLQLVLEVLQVVLERSKDAAARGRRSISFDAPGSRCAH